LTRHIAMKMVLPVNSLWKSRRWAKLSSKLRSRRRFRRKNPWPSVD
jgi:hypothetical protein